MVQRRTRALVELVMCALLLPITVCAWKFQFDHADEVDAEPHAVSPAALITGAIGGVTGHWLSDHDVFHIRTSRRRRALFSFHRIVRSRLVKRYASEPSAFRYNYTVGELIGIIGYRIWYGLLHSLPGEDNETPS